MKVTAKHKILLFLGNHEVANMMDIASELDYSRDWVKHALSQLKRSGFVDRFKREHSTIKGRQIYYYYLTEAGEKKVKYLRKMGVS